MALRDLVKLARVVAHGGGKAYVQLTPENLQKYLPILRRQMARNKGRLQTYGSMADILKAQPAGPEGKFKNPLTVYMPSAEAKQRLLRRGRRLPPSGINFGGKSHPELDEGGLAKLSSARMKAARILSIMRKQAADDYEYGYEPPSRGRRALSGAGSGAAKGGLGGAALGALVGGYLAYKRSQGKTVDNKELLKLIALGALEGGAIGGTGGAALGAGVGGIHGALSSPNYKTASAAGATGAALMRAMRRAAKGAGKKLKGPGLIAGKKLAVPDAVKSMAARFGKAYKASH